MRYLSELKTKLEAKPIALQLFRSTVFGHWLDIKDTYGILY